jgi:hypothetical protein
MIRSFNSLLLSVKDLVIVLAPTIGKNRTSVLPVAQCWLPGFYEDLSTHIAA